MLKINILLLIIILFTNCESKKNDYFMANTGQNKIKNDTINDQFLTELEHFVIFEKGTERAFTGEYWDFFEDGHYECRICGQILFLSLNKYNSNCGWPTFDQAILGSVKYHEDFTQNMHRIEFTCSKCNAHLGHVFKDGPKKTTGNRYCTNSVSLKFIKK